MPNYFQLIRKSDPEAGPVAFTVIDEEMCAHFNVSCHETRYYQVWYDCVGAVLAAGRGWDEVRDVFKDCEELLPVIDWLEDNFTPNSWAGRGNRGGE